MSSSACLVLSPPEYEEPDRTAPFLVAADAFPDPRQVIVIKDQEFIEFGGAVISEDNGDLVQLALYLDYGQSVVAGTPFRKSIPVGTVPAGTLAEGPREFRGKKWYLAIDPVTTGCHTVTMVATHEFDSNNTGCPADGEDYSFLVWQVVKCDPSGGPCPVECAPLPCGDQCPSCSRLPVDAAAEGGPP